MSLFFMMKLLIVSSEAAIAGIEFKKPSCIKKCGGLGEFNLVSDAGEGAKHGKNY